MWLVSCSIAPCCVADRYAIKLFTSSCVVFACVSHVSPDGRKTTITDALHMQNVCMSYNYFLLSTTLV